MEGLKIMIDQRITDHVKLYTKGEIGKNEFVDKQNDIWKSILEYGHALK
jgi:hypothetical protein